MTPPIKKFLKSTRKTIHTLFCEGTDVYSETLHREFIQKVPFLPKEVINNKRYAIDSGRFLTNQEWRTLRDSLQTQSNNTQLHTTPESFVLMDKAAIVFVSTRFDTVTKETFVVAKLWYGNLPETNSQGNYHE